MSIYQHRDGRDAAEMDYGDERCTAAAVRIAAADSAASPAAVRTAEEEALSDSGLPPPPQGRQTLYLTCPKCGRSGGEIELYQSKEHLTADLKEAVAAGKRCFVAANSKSLVERLAKTLKNAVGPTLRMLRVTSRTAATGRVRAFIGDPCTESRKYDVVLSSPTLGTGIDITFPHNEVVFDVVFAFFDADVNTHLDEQHLPRVSNPGAFKGWISDAVPLSRALDLDHRVRPERRAPLGVRRLPGRACAPPPLAGPGPRGSALTSAPRRCARRARYCN